MKHLIWSIVLVVACGGKSGAGGGDDAPDDAPEADAPGTGIDARFPVGCATPDPTKPQCANCIDDDGDGAVDGFDVECTGPLDMDEGSFKTGIPGDNVDAVKQDCFFDGNSGSGNDGCEIHACCLLGITNKADCMIGQSQYEPAECPPPIGTVPLTQQCINFCSPLTPPGCDCFGCCTVCDAGSCYDITTNSPNCTAETLGDPTKCPRCTQVPSCGQSDCGGQTCILCPGQDPSTLPPSCNMMPTCPSGQQSCIETACPAGAYCQSGCCVGVIL